MRRNVCLAAALICSTWFGGLAAADEEPPPTGPRLEIYGFAMTDIGYDFGSVGDPAWFDVLRTTKLPASEDAFGPSGRLFAGVRQTRFGAKAWLPTPVGEVFTQFEWELFGVGVDAGQTTIRLRHAYGELGQFGAGQYWSPFMDIDVFPNSIEYWGPPGMAFFRNVQVRWMPIKGDSRVTIALERPGASADTGVYADRLQLMDIIPKFQFPDLSAEARYGGPWGYVELAGILRSIAWDDVGGDPQDLSGSEIGWGVNLSSNLKLSIVTLRLQILYGQGIANYMNDATVDVAIDSTDPVLEADDAIAVPLVGVVAFADIQWSPMFSSSVGYSATFMDNAIGQNADSFQTGHYALGNVLVYPAKNVMMGAEFQWGRRENFDDGFTVDDFRLQFSFKYSFSHMFGGGS
jgi:hypothetical protein